MTYVAHTCCVQLTAVVRVYNYSISSVYIVFRYYAMESTAGELIKSRIIEPVCFLPSIHQSARQQCHIDHKDEESKVFTYYYVVATCIDLDSMAIHEAKLLSMSPSVYVSPYIASYI